MPSHAIFNAPDGTIESRLCLLFSENQYNMNIGKGAVKNFYDLLQLLFHLSIHVIRSEL